MINRGRSIFSKLKFSNKNFKRTISLKELVSDIVSFLEDEKIFEIVCITLEGRSQEADFMIISSGNSSRHVSSVSEKLLEYLKVHKGILSRVEGMETANWVLIDSGDILINIFKPEVRDYYQLEKMWMV
tara:strand:+ start:107 stop:493 length:387 start_codon:yes stop_codon:yes gene_type:complete